MTSPPEKITITCPSCDKSFEDWWRPSINLTLEKFDGDYLRRATVKTCPHCKAEVRLDTLVVGEDGVWRAGVGNEVDTARTSGAYRQSETFFMPTQGPEDWRRFLAHPSHWKTGYSARSLAYCWEDAKGFPDSVVAAFTASAIPSLANPELIAALAEYKVPLPGGIRSSQNDIFVIAKSGGELIIIMVEGKKDEEFQQRMSDWFATPSLGKKKRLKFLCDKLGLEQEAVVNPRIWYQLVHRTASAIIMAEKLNAKHAVMLVHSFSQEHKWFDAYEAFVELFGVRGKIDSVVDAGDRNGVRLYLGWATGEATYLKC